MRSVRTHTNSRKSSCWVNALGNASHTESSTCTAVTLRVTYRILIPCELYRLYNFISFRGFAASVLLQLLKAFAFKMTSSIGQSDTYGDSSGGLKQWGGECTHGRGGYRWIVIADPTPIQRWPRLLFLRYQPVVPTLVLSRQTGVSCCPGHPEHKKYAEL